MVLLHGKECLQHKKAVTASKCWRAPKLKASTMFFEKSKCLPIHDRAKNLGAYVHEHDALPFVGIGEISALGGHTHIGFDAIGHDRHLP